MIESEKVVAFIKASCPFCVKLQNKFNLIAIKNLKIVDIENDQEIFESLKKHTNYETVP